MTVRVEQAGDVERRAIGQLARADRQVRLLADDEKLALEGIGIGAIGAARHEELPDHRGVGLDAVTERRGIDRHVAPSEQALPLGGDKAGDHGFADPTGLDVTRQEHHSDAVMAGLWELQLEPLGLGSKQPVGQLNEDAGAVARKRIGADRAPMGEVMEYVDPIQENAMTLAIFDVRNEADAAGIMLVARIVKSWPRLHSFSIPPSPPAAADSAVLACARPPRTASWGAPDESRSTSAPLTEIFRDQVRGAGPEVNLIYEKSQIYI